LSTYIIWLLLRGSGGFKKKPSFDKKCYEL
jgi:hypothetical protein